LHVDLLSIFINNPAINLQRIKLNFFGISLFLSQEPYSFLERHLTSIVESNPWPQG